jgi:glycine/D-amino acid oxidase-like deaminating enzyme
VSFPWPESAPTAAHRAAFADAEPQPFWLANLPEREPHPPLEGITDADLCIVGGGYTGLWAALHAKAADPQRDVILLEGTTIGYGASGRNGGFCIASLTHGTANGIARFEHEVPVLEGLATENFAGIKADLATHGIDCDFEETGDVVVLLEPYQQEWVDDEVELMRRFGHEVEIFDREQMQNEVASPTYLGGIWDKTNSAVLDPGKLADGLRQAALRLGVRIHEHTEVTGLSGGHVRTANGSVSARKTLLATSAYKPLLREMRRYVAPVYDYALMSEPLSAEQKSAIGWNRRQGVGDGANQFHYYRQTTDNRILFGGYDAVYRYGGPVRPDLDDDEHSFAMLSQHFFTTFPQLEGIRFSHRWGGAIDTCSRFSAFFGTAHGGRTAYALGYTGLGVASTRFGAQTALDLLDGNQTEVTRLDYVRKKPVPFPPEPLRYAVIQLTRNRLDAADHNQGRRGLWLRLLDRLGLGFDS